jgi:cytochrome c2
MSLFHFKSILAVFFLLAGLIAVISMLTLMGRAERKISAIFLRRTHKIAGAVFAVLLVIISYICIKYWAMIGDQLSLRAVLRATLALGLIIVFLLKISFVEFYREFIRYAPVMGMIVFSLAFVVFCTSAGFFFLSSGQTVAFEKGEVEEPPTVLSAEGDAQKGKFLFEDKCSFCHYADRSESKMGPGLKEILKREKLPASGRPATPENVREQLLSPYRNMPSFKTVLSEQDISDLLAYLNTL